MLSTLTGIDNTNASYFNVGQIGEAQWAYIAARWGMDIETLLRFLAPNLG